MKLTFTLDIPRELAERLSARAISEGKNLDAVVIETLEMRKGVNERVLTHPLASIRT